MAKGDRSLDVQDREVREMRNAETVLGIIHKREWVTGEPDDGKLSSPVRGAVCLTLHNINQNELMGKSKMS